MKIFNIYLFMEVMMLSKYLIHAIVAPTFWKFKQTFFFVYLFINFLTYISIEWCNNEIIFILNGNIIILFYFFYTWCNNHISWCCSWTWQQVRDTVMSFSIKLPSCLFWPETFSSDDFSTFFSSDFGVSVFLAVEHTCVAPHGGAYAAPVCFWQPSSVTARSNHRCSLD